MSAGVVWGWLLWERSVPPPLAVAATAALAAEALVLAGGAAAVAACAGCAAGAVAQWQATGALARRGDVR